MEYAAPSPSGGADSPQEAVLAETDPTPGHGHQGSASTTLSGRMVVLVWLLSIAVHLLGLVLMVVLVFPYSSRGDRPPPDVQVELVGPVDPIDPGPRVELNFERSTNSTDPIDAPIEPQRASQVETLAASKKPELTIIGIGSGGGDFSEFGLTAGTGTGPEFFGLGGSVRGARRIVYVVDRSGSMLDTFDHVRRELLRSIGALRRSQKFHVIFFNAGAPLENPPRRLVNAIRAQKDALAEFLATVFPAGSTKPARAMRRALALEPDLIYFLTDGAFDPALLTQLDRWNQSRSVRIFTLAFFDRSGAELLKRIARDHGGEFKFVSELDIK